MFAVTRFTDTAHAARALASVVADDLSAALTAHTRALLLVSGGRSPVAFFNALRERPLDWKRIDISLADERGVAACDDAANAALVRANLLVEAASAACWIALMPDECVLATQDEWQRVQQAVLLANADAALGQPAVIVLGMGSDGHTASLFPDAPQWPQARITTDRYVALQPGQAPHARVSLSLHALIQQQRCYLWAVGAEKAATLETLAELCDAVARGVASAARLAQAGPLACLMADPDVMLEVFCCGANDQEATRCRPVSAGR